MGGDLIDLGYDVALGIHLDGVHATHTLEDALEGELDTGLAHDVARLVADTFRDLRFLELLGADGTGVAQHVAGEITLGIRAHGAGFDGDTGEDAGVFLDEGDRPHGDIGRHDALGLGSLAFVADALADGLTRNAQHIGETMYHVAVVGNVRIGDHGE